MNRTLDTKKTHIHAHKFPEEYAKCSEIKMSVS